MREGWQELAFTWFIRPQNLGIHVIELAVLHGGEEIGWIGDRALYAGMPQEGCLFEPSRLKIATRLPGPKPPSW